MPFWKIIEHNEKIAFLILNRKEKINAFTWEAFISLPEIIEKLKKYYVVIIKGEGENFSSGLDFADFMKNNSDILQSENPIKDFEKKINLMQEGFICLREAEFITIAEVYGYCIGAGLNLIAACDLRFANKNAILSLKELEFAIVPDLGALNFLPKIVNEGFLKEITFTARNFTATEGYNNGLFNKLFDSTENMEKYVLNISEQIAKKDKKALLTAKKAINNNYSLKQLAEWNAKYLLSSGILNKLT